MESSSDITDALRATTRRVLADLAGSAEVRRIMASPDGFDRRLWSGLTDVGLPGLTVPTEYGGAGLGLPELAAVLEETGRALLPAPLLGTVLATQALLGTAAAAAVLPGVAAGDTLATVALDAGLRARRQGRGYRLDGVAPQVLDGHVADLVVAVAGADLFLIDAAAPARTQLGTLDQTRRLARLTFDHTPATRIGGAPDRIRDLAAIALAAEQVGGAARCLELAVEYAKVRVQFGRPIGRFQAIQHRCAEVLVAVESARSAAHHAARVAGTAELPAAAAVARIACSAAYTLAAGENIQIHGGIGITWEHDAHLHLKRARSSATLFGAPARYQARLAELVVGPPAP